MSDTPTAKRDRFLKGDSYRYLPRFLRDFHDQKAVFKSVERHMGRDRDSYGVDWMAGQCYVVDRFLKYMALHGYTLQRTQVSGIDFCDLDATLREDRNRDVEVFKQMLAAAPLASRDASGGTAEEG